jgi:hypothetical protein
MNKIFNNHIFIFIGLLLVVSIAGCDDDRGYRVPLLITAANIAATPPGPAGSAPNLGTASTYGLIAYNAITNSAGQSHIYGDMALTQPLPGGTIVSVVGFGLIGVIPNQTSALVTNSNGVTPGVINAADNGVLSAAQLAQLQADSNAAWLDLLGRVAPATVLTDAASCVGVPGGTFGGATDLSGYVLSPGIFHSTATYALTNTLGPLVLDAGGNPNAVFIIRSSASPGFNTGIGGGSVVLRGGAQAKNVFWVMTNAATIGTGSFMRGTFVIGAALTLNGFAIVEGRIFAGASGAGALTLTSTNVITVPAP